MARRVRAAAYQPLHAPAEGGRVGEEDATEQCSLVGAAESFKSSPLQAIASEAGATAATTAATERGMNGTSSPPPPASSGAGSSRSRDVPGESGPPSTPRKASSASLVKDGLKPNLSAVEATAQLKVLCRKFAALTEKVKEETRIREEAEREVRRLRAIVEGNDAPVVASYRAETQTYIRDLKGAQESLRQELRTEKDKNAKLVQKALELEKEKSALLASVGATAAAKSRHHDGAQPSEYHVARQNSGWDREQVTKIHDTLRMTIDELQDELTRKEEELVSYRERLQRERSRVKALEAEVQDREEASREERSVLKELESSIQEQRDQFEAVEKEMQMTEERLEEEATMRQTLEQQIETLNDVNAALEQRAKALVRRLELSQSMVDAMDELKMQVRDVEVDKETLVRSIKDVKDQHFLRETQWKAQLEQLRSEKLVLASQISDLQSEITSLRTQNSLFSEWMLVRSDNVTAAHQQQKLQQTQSRYEQFEPDQLHVSSQPQPHRPHHEPDHHLTSHRARVRPLHSKEADDSTYVHTSVRCPLSPSKTRSMTTASPIRQPQSWVQPSRRTSVSSSSTSSDEIDAWMKRDPDAALPRTKPVGRVFSGKTPLATVQAGSSTSTSRLTDHERLRELMSRNRELQNRLQQETVATRNLEQEISHITSKRG